ncbi:cAMP-binding domain of CRP or a regulatory subunit of cAMP-dependent protein kinases [Flavobacterium aquidurense]|uniref:Cyclic nucleotide-binding protein n=1 Tax=Flavobacterium frigidimaris TaxID=262320 RepID=A0ABX4BN42_FLAFR|nr:Crp/Fnr family transcriptional regulator [Flavobacterium frigidimaris]OXA77895.1 cyclic nucleotide-binding protein [Flavobacterium frigidimaris]SDZ65098.1 cAMP-binding domain of CRP or a regulatory subunit of cAMP-dependent protein kinases [Flavobacterium aquidurense]
MKTLFQSIQAFSVDDLNQLDNFITFRTLKKGELLLAENQVCNEIVFIKKGILRSYFFNHQGDEITNCFAFENEFMASFSSFITREIAQENIQALVDTELQVLNRDSLEKLYKTGIHWREIGRKLTEMEYVTLQKRMISFQKLSGKQRYEELYQNHQKYIQLIPLQYLASYLGVTPRHLSRIRKAIL